MEGSEKYERLGDFCFMCGRSEHMEQHCAILLAQDVDDGVRNWGTEIKAELKRFGGGGDNSWLRDEKGAAKFQEEVNTPVSDPVSHAKDNDVHRENEIN